jgi:hypothetical protein
MLERAGEEAAARKLLTSGPALCESSELRDRGPNSRDERCCEETGERESNRPGARESSSRSEDDEPIDGDASELLREGWAATPAVIAARAWYEALTEQSAFHARKVGNSRSKRKRRADSEAAKAGGHDHKYFCSTPG